MHDSWLILTESGQQFGPVAKRTLDDWVREGRFAAGCTVFPPGSTRWLPLREVYPEIIEGLAHVVVPLDPESALEIVEAKLPDHNLAISVMSLLGLCFPPLMIFAYFIARRNLAAMDQGLIDDSRRVTAEALTRLLRHFVFLACLSMASIGFMILLWVYLK